MKKILVTLAVSATLAIGGVASPTTAEARWHHGFPVAPVIGGLAAGAGGMTYADVYLQAEREFSTYNFEVADTISISS